MDEARKIDLADRYINNKCTKYLLRAGKVVEARATAALFAKPEAGDAEQHLRDMQATWYELEVGRAMASLGERGPALKKLLAVEKHYADFIEDQFDFHTYCVRKMTLRAYVAVLRFEDEIKEHVAFRTSADAAARVYLQLHDESVQAAETAARAKLAAEAQPEQAALAAAQAQQSAKEEKARAKRDKMKQRKAADKKAADDKAAAALAAEKAGDSSAQDDKLLEAAKKPSVSSEDAPVVDEDPLGLKLAALPPLAEAARLAADLDKFAPQHAATHELAFDVARRRGKPLLALRALKRLAKAATQDAPEVLLRVAFFAHTFDALLLTSAGDDDASSSSSSPAARAAVAEVVRTELAALCGTARYAGAADALAKVRAYAQLRPRLPERAAAAEALATLDGECAEEAAHLVLTADAAPEPFTKPLPVKVFEHALRLLTSLDQPKAAAAFKQSAQNIFPSAEAFSC